MQLGFFKGGKKYARGINQVVIWTRALYLPLTTPKNPINPFILLGAKWQLKDFTLSNARRIYSATPCDWKG